MADIPSDIKPLSAADFSPNLFWDINPDELDSEKHIKYIVSRVIEAGTFDDWKLLCRHFTLTTIIKVAQTLRSIEPKSLAFLSVIGHVPIESFRCYTLKQSSQKHWIY